uniref:C-type lectin domain-containing protein n=1 Tax=Mastacembelus armatus TaxID=205130 RepID=A0A3Q3LZ77_9TELE
CIFLLLLFLGHCYFFTCQLFEYHFINEQKTWKEAQAYCRINHTDLATVSNMTDMKRLLKNSTSTNNQNRAWIGLYNQTGDRTWHWSLPGLEMNKTEIKWNDGEPNDDPHPENCGFIKRNQTHNDILCGDISCREPGPFICYNETEQNDKRLHVITVWKKWLEAQHYCREHHTDLVSGQNQINDELNKKLSKDQWYAIGLFRDTWGWSDGSSFSFRHWNQAFTDDDTETCAMTLLNQDGTWDSDDCNKRNPFFCYDDKVILINENKTWVEALYYCREKYHDLVSITNLDEQRWIKEKAKKANSPYVWLGMRYTCSLGFWFWVNDEVITYENWAAGRKTEHCFMSGAMDSGGQHQWVSKQETEKFNFICSKC